LLAGAAWLSSAVMHGRIGRYVDRTGDYGPVLLASGLLPMAALAVVVLLWDRPPRGEAVRR
jgi:hypothetical protein